MAIPNHGMLLIHGFMLQIFFPNGNQILKLFKPILSKFSYFLYIF